MKYILHLSTLLLLLVVLGGVPAHASVTGSTFVTTLYTNIERVLVDDLPPAPDGTKGLRIVTDDADCDPLTVDDGVVLCLDTGAQWELATGGGGSSTVLDLGDNGINESTGLLEIATTGDANAIATLPTADKLLLDFSVPWLIADVATLATTGDDALSFFSTGTFEDARISQSSVTQHQASLTITESQISDLAHTVDTDDQVATEVPYTPTTGADWTDPNPTEVGGALDTLAARDVTADDLSDDSITALSDVTAISGNTTTIATTSGALTSGNCVEIDASGNLVDAGAGCGGGIDADGDGVLEFACDPTASTCTMRTNEVPTEPRFVFFGGGAANDSIGFNVTSGQAWIRSDSGLSGGLSLDSLTGPVNLRALQSSGLVTAQTGGSPVTRWQVNSTHETGFVRRVDSPSTATCTSTGDASPGFVVITPSTSEVYLTVLDVDGCDVVISESEAVPGQRLDITVVSIAGGTANFADSSGVQEMGTGCSLPLYGTLGAKYIDTSTNDRWVKRFCETDV